VKDADIVEALREKLAVSSGRHLYGVLGSYSQLNSFDTKLHKVKLQDGTKFPKAVSVNKGILESIPDDEFKLLVENEAKRPEPTAAHVGKAFEIFLRNQLRGINLLVLSNLEMLFAYHLELNLLRTMAADDDRIILLLPGKRSAGRVTMFPNHPDGSYTLPMNLIADNHLWELRD
jgi:hypothetical protein